MLSSSQSLIMGPSITAIINDIMESEASSPILLILEDYYLIDSPPIHDSIDFLLDHLPPALHLFLVSRSDPSLLLSCLCARHQVMEIRARDLRFTVQETAAFLNKTMTLNLTSEVDSVLERRTEGWIAGLQLATMSLQQHTVVYFIAGLIFATVMNYEELFATAEYAFMRPFDHPLVILGPSLQIFRGALLALAFLPFRKLIMGSKRGWIYIFVMLCQKHQVL
jgi:ATP/maltotriose-dependent transcriptional regulator MalT